MSCRVAMFPATVHVAPSTVSITAAVAIQQPKTAPRGRWPLKTPQALPPPPFPTTRRTRCVLARAGVPPRRWRFR